MKQTVGKLDMLRLGSERRQVLVRLQLHREMPRIGLIRLDRHVGSERPQRCVRSMEFWKYVLISPKIDPAQEHGILIRLGHEPASVILEHEVRDTIAVIKRDPVSAAPDSGGEQEVDMLSLRVDLNIVVGIHLVSETNHLNLWITQGDLNRFVGRSAIGDQDDIGDLLVRFTVATDDFFVVSCAAGSDDFHSRITHINPHMIKLATTTLFIRGTGPYHISNPHRK